MLFFYFLYLSWKFSERQSFKNCSILVSVTFFLVYFDQQIVHIVFFLYIDLDFSICILVNIFSKSSQSHRIHQLYEVILKKRKI